jgi:ribosome-associated heat shock protein Hsp15
MRIDKLLWYLRLTRSRTLAQALAEAGHIRLNGRRIDRAHQKIATGDVLTIPWGNSVQVVELLAMPIRRGPAPEARAHYRVLDAAADHPIAASEIDTLQEGSLQP